MNNPLSSDMSCAGIRLADIRQTLNGYQPLLLPVEDLRQAAVAMILRERQGVELLFIERARRQGDPWSGDIGFPGGRPEKSDGDIRATAERETREELGIDLENARFLGRLDDLNGAHLPVLVSCFAYELRDPSPRMSLSDEVASAFWVPLREILDPARHHESVTFFRNRPLQHPAIDLLGPGRPLLWGITYRMTLSLLQLLDCPPEPPRRLNAPHALR